MMPSQKVISARIAARKINRCPLKRFSSSPRKIILVRATLVATVDLCKSNAISGSSDKTFFIAVSAARTYYLVFADFCKAARSIIFYSPKSF